MASPRPSVMDLLRRMADERREAYERAVADGTGICEAHRLYVLAKADILRAELAGLGKAPRRPAPAPKTNSTKLPQMDLFGATPSTNHEASSP